MVDIAIHWIDLFAVNNTTFGFPGTCQLESVKRLNNWILENSAVASFSR